MDDWIKEQIEEAHLDSQRVIGSIENVPQKLVNEVIQQLRSKGFENIEVIETPSNDFTIVYYSDECPKRIRELYRKYEESDSDPYSLTREEHAELGRAFGFSEEEIESFLEWL